MESEGQQEVGEIQINKSFNPMVVGLIIVLVLVIGGILMSSRKPASIKEQPQVIGESTQNTESPVSIAATESVVKEIEIEAGSFYYNPKEIRVKQGEKVRIILTAKDMQHDFNIDELALDGPVIKAGESTTIEFAASEIGKFEYYCSVGQHRQNGQVGTLVVEE